MEQRGSSSGMTDAYRRRRQRAAQEAELARKAAGWAGVAAPVIGTVGGGILGAAIGGPMGASAGMGIGGAVGAGVGGLAGLAGEQYSQNKMTPFEEAEAKRRAKLQALRDYQNSVRV